jgi:hypothetical protein
MKGKSSVTLLRRGTPFMVVLGDLCRNENRANTLSRERVIIWRQL